MRRWSNESASSLSASVHLKRSRALYEALGSNTRAAPDDDVVFFEGGGMIVGLWDRAKLAPDSGVEDGGG